MRYGNNGKEEKYKEFIRGTNMDFFDMYPDMFAKTRYYTPDECIAIGNKELEFVLLPNDIRRPNGREYRKLMEIINNG